MGTSFGLIGAYPCSHFRGIDECFRRYTGKIRSFTTVYDLRISPYTVTVRYDRNMITCFMAKYGRIQSVFGMYTVVYDAVYDRKQPFTESVTVDLGSSIEQ